MTPLEYGYAVAETRKRNAGASRLVRRDTNGTSLQVASYYSEQYDAALAASRAPERDFLPDVVLIEQGNHFGAVSYAELRARGQIAHFSQS